MVGGKKEADRDIKRRGGIYENPKPQLRFEGNKPLF